MINTNLNQRRVGQAAVLDQFLGVGSPGYPNRRGVFETSEMTTPSETFIRPNGNRSLICDFHALWNRMRAFEIVKMAFDEKVYYPNRYLSIASRYVRVSVDAGHDQFITCELNRGTEMKFSRPAMSEVKVPIV